MLSRTTADRPTIKLQQLMAFAMSEEKVEKEYGEYLENPNRYLYLAKDEAFIGIELKSGSRCEIRHIAVTRNARNKGFGAEMIEEVIKFHHLQEIFAETDQDAVGFYQKTGFKIKSLGEKYPGRERFYCAKTLPSK